MLLWVDGLENVQLIIIYLFFLEQMLLANLNSDGRQVKPTYLQVRLVRVSYNISHILMLLYCVEFFTNHMF